MQFFIGLRSLCLKKSWPFSEVPTVYMYRTVERDIAVRIQVKDTVHAGMQVMWTCNHVLMHADAYDVREGKGKGGRTGLVTGGGGGGISHALNISLIFTSPAFVLLMYRTGALPACGGWTCLRRAGCCGAPM
jgi:hypothetical protein